MSVTDTFRIEKARKAEKLQALKRFGRPCKLSERVDVQIEQDSLTSPTLLTVKEEGHLVVIVEGKIEKFQPKKNSDLVDYWVSLRAIKWGMVANRVRVTIRSENLFSFAQVLVHEDGWLVEEVVGETEVWNTGNEARRHVVVLTKVGMDI